MNVVNATELSSSLFFTLKPVIVYSTSLAVCTIVNVCSCIILGFFINELFLLTFLILVSKLSSLLFDVLIAQLSSKSENIELLPFSIRFITYSLSSNFIKSKSFSRPSEIKKFFSSLKTYEI